MANRERRFEVALRGRRVGELRVTEDVTRFVFDEAYLGDPEREVLGLRFEEEPRRERRANMRLPPWFSNLLPEGALRDWIAEQRGVSVTREAELLAEVGMDLPGAVAVLPPDVETIRSKEREPVVDHNAPRPNLWKFSLAGVQLKFSMLAKGERFTAPASGEDGQWIVKLPDANFEHVPANERAMMELARRAGIDVPETRLVHRDAIEGIPEHLWPKSEIYAYAVRRFDRSPDGGRVHMEDFAQVRDFYHERKYEGAFETIAALVYRGRDRRSLEEFVRRLAFIVLIQNADAHLKNWSLLYTDPRVPVLSPAYDLVCTGVYSGIDRDLGLRLDGSRRFEDASLASFERLQRKLGIAGSPTFAELAEAVVDRALAAWPEIEPLLDGTPLGPTIRKTLHTSAAFLRRR